VKLERTKNETCREESGGLRRTSEAGVGPIKRRNTESVDDEDEVDVWMCG
jgi:hypothetical protein